MRVNKCAGSWTVVASLLLAHEVPAGEVVGLRTPHENFFMAVRGVLPESTVVTGIQFYSNDATVFPAVMLATDATDSHLPAPETTVRSVENVSGGPGAISVSFTPYRATGGQHLWAIIKFPPSAGLRARGLGGGPGIGWRETPGLPGERSLFSVDGSMNEFTPAFNISVVTLGQTASRNPGKPESRATRRPDFAVRARSAQGRSETVFELALPEAGRIVIDIYSIAGRQITRIAENAPISGTREVEWHGVDTRGVRVPSGIYLYKASLGKHELQGKLLLLR